MRFQTELVSGHLTLRYKRFLADVTLDDGRHVTAHCPNPGAMLGLKDPGMKVWLEPNDDPKKKLKFGWRLAQTSADHMVGIDTSLPNKLVAEALTAGGIAELVDYKTIRPEQKYGENSRIDFLLQSDGRRDAYVEVKNVHLLREDDWAEFPDCPTERGTKHLKELIKIVENGQRAVMLYVVQHSGCKRFKLARDKDPKYAAAFDLARAAGVEVICYETAISTEEIRLTNALPVHPL